MKTPKQPRKAKAKTLPPGNYPVNVKSVKTTDNTMQLTLDVDGLQHPATVKHIIVSHPLPLNNNFAAVDLRKVQWATLHYVNQHGQKQRHKPVYGSYTVYGDFVNATDKVFGTSETMLDYAKRKGLLDVWTPVCTLHITANRKLRYVGNKALSMWAAWEARIFGGKK